VERWLGSGPLASVTARDLRASEHRQPFRSGKSRPLSFAEGQCQLAALLGGCQVKDSSAPPDRASFPIPFALETFNGQSKIPAGDPQ
jgi:hypothetical protein